MSERSPHLVALLSLIVPGLGQWWLGRQVRGATILLVSVILVVLLFWLDLSPWSWLALLPLWAVNVWDAYQLASGERPNTALLVLIAALPVYVIGWQVTNISVERFLANANRVRPLVSGLLRPEFIAQERDIAVAGHGFYIPCPAPEPVPSDPAEPGGIIDISAECGVPGDRIAVVGEGFPANQEVSLWWVNTVGAASRVRVFGAFEDFSVGEDGAFEAEITVPQQRVIEVPRPHVIEVRYVASVGDWYATRTFWLVAQRMGETIAQALMATFVGALLAMPFSFFGARNLMAGNPLLTVLYYISRTVMNILRSIEPLIMAIVFVVWVGLGPFAGVLALMVHTIAALGKLYSESIESIDPGPIEAIRATGASQLQIIAFGVVPQVLPPWIAFTVYRWDINVRMSTIIGFVGGGGIGFLLAQWIRLSDFRAAGAAIWAIAVVVVVLDYFSAEVRERVI
ncbi:MAG: phosphonate ABC transporter, permease protein PhnE [Chloroflexota bacterium]|nr:phosphonate ABC transporter, permease protein PhnE [Chloroflexota bacterium]